MPVYCDNTSDGGHYQHTGDFSTRFTMAAWIYVRSDVDTTGGRAFFGTNDYDVTDALYLRYAITAGYVDLKVNSTDHNDVSDPFTTTQAYYVVIASDGFTQYLGIYDKTAASWVLDPDSNSYSKSQQVDTADTIFFGCGEKAGPANFINAVTGVEYAYVRFWDHGASARIAKSALDLERQSTSAVRTSDLILDEPLTDSSTLGVFTADGTPSTGSYDFEVGSGTSVAPLAMGAYSRMRNG